MKSSSPFSSGVRAATRGRSAKLVENIVEALHDHALHHATSRPAVLCRRLFGRE